MVANGVLGGAMGDKNGVPLGLFCTELSGDPESEGRARCNLGRWLKGHFCDIARHASAMLIRGGCDGLVYRGSARACLQRWCVLNCLICTLTEVVRALSATGAAAPATAPATVVATYLTYRRISRGRRNHHA